MRKRLEPEGRRDQILEGALHAFATKGFAVPNREIAEAAGLNTPALIYHYFPSKEELLVAVVRKYAAPIRILNEKEELLSLPLREFLLRVAKGYLATLDEPKAFDLIKVLMGESLRRPDVASLFAEAGPASLLKFLSQAMARYMDEGSLRRTEPEWAARAFLGPMMTVLFTKAFAGITPTIPSDQLAENAVETFLGGMAQR